MNDRRGSRPGVARGTLPIDAVTSLDSTMPPTPAKDLLTAHGARVLVFSHDAELCNAIKTAAANRYSTRVIDEWRDVLSQVEAEESRIVLVDVDALGINVERALKDLKSRTDWLVVLIAAKQQQAQDFMRFWSERKIHRLLIKPAAVGITRLLLESAVSRYLELKDAYDHVDDDSPTVRSLRSPEFGLFSRWRTGLAAAIGILVVAGLFVSGSWLLGVFDFEGANQAGAGSTVVIAPSSRSRPTILDEVTPTEAAQSIPSEAPSTSDSERPQAQSSQSPPTVAAAPPRQVAEAAPEPASSPPRSVETAASSTPVVPLATPVVDTERSQRVSDAAFAPDAFQAVVAAAPSGTDVSRGAAPGLSAAEVAGSEPNVPPAAEPVTELGSFIALASVRLEQGLLTEPAGDSAGDYLARASASDPRHPDVSEFRSAFGVVLADTARAAVGDGDLDRAASLVEAAARFGVSSDALVTVSNDVSAALQARDVELVARRQEEERLLSAGVSERIDQGRLIEPSGESALDGLNTLRDRNPEHPRLPALQESLSVAIESEVRARMAAGDWDVAENHLNVLETMAGDQRTLDALRAEFDIERRQSEYLSSTMPIGRMQLVDAVAPDYPRAALRSDVTGWVDLEFVVDTDGLTGRVAVVESEPVGLFEDAAVAAVQRYEFEPFEQDGHVYERRGRVRIRFELD